MFAIVTNYEKDPEGITTGLVAQHLQANNSPYVIVEQYRNKNGRIQSKVVGLPDELECVIVLGGDGTMIQAAHDFAMQQIPIVGINLGTLGFLAETEKQNIHQTMNQLIHRDYYVEPHMMLSAQVETSEGTLKKFALNDIVVARRGISRVLKTGIYVNGEYVNAYTGDGVVVCTPTGSTGYSLSAGGPVVTPEAELMVITPICPHSLNARSIIVSCNDTITLRVLNHRQNIEDTVATIDGIYSVAMNTGDSVEIKMAEVKTRLIRLKRNSFFDILRTKLGDETFR